jgi:6-pyruvoyltetrahydropterin/6-carboxytetrahydropterin synthase
MEVLVTRRFGFSASHRYWREEWSAEENWRIFGKCTSPHGHGHNYTLFVTVAGPVDPVSGMVINLTELKGLVDEVLEEFDHRYLNEDTPYFRTLVPTTENLVRLLWDLIASQLPHHIRLHELRLHETEDLYSEYRGSVSTLLRRYHFAAAHRMHAAGLSDEENRQLFGKCNNPRGHGHEYYLEVMVAGDVHPQTGMVLDLATMDQRVGAVLEGWDHRHLDHEVPALQGAVSTGENLIRILWDELEPRFDGQLRRLRLWETSKNLFTFPPDAP